AVRGGRRAGDAPAGAGNGEMLERPLDRAVLAATAMERDEAAREALAAQLEEVAHRGVERMGVHALRAQRLQHAVAAHERDFALGGAAAEEHRHLAEAHGASPTIRTSGTSSIPWRSATFLRTSSISHSRSEERRVGKEG